VTERIPVSEQDWIEACAIAWRALCTGQDDWHVNPGESWASAISRCAALLLNYKGYALAKGYDSNRYDAIARALAGRSSCANDGMVQRELLRVAIASLPAERTQADYEARALAEMRKVPVLE